jgi:hypothetical protein
MVTTVVAAILAIAGSCAVIGADGTDPRLWESGSVLYAEVVNVEHNVGNTYRIALRPIATLSGSFDPAIHTEISTNASIGDQLVDGSLIRKVPEKSAKVVVLVQRLVSPPSQPNSYGIPNGPLNFGSGIGLVEVSGFDDPKVTEMIESVRKIRSKQREEAEQKAAAEKKGK